MTLSTHVLDTALGRPAPGIVVSLARREGSAWIPLNHTKTDPDGRVRHLLPEHQALATGTYRIRFEIESYFAAQATFSLYPHIDITFQVIDPDQHHHIPLLLTPNGYTTYRGS